MNDKLLKPAEVAEYLGVSEPTLADWRYRGKGPRYLICGKHRRYRRSDVEAWLNTRYAESA